MTDEVIIIASNGQVLTFKDYTYAKVTLMSKFWPHIIKDAEQLCATRNLVELKQLMPRTLGMTREDETTQRFLAMSNKVQLAQELWPMLVSHGRRTINMAFNRNVPDATRSNTITYFCDYSPGEDEVLDLSYLKLTPQARVLVDMFVEKIKPFGKAGVPEHVFIKCLNEIEDKLRTRQRPWIIFNYYRRQLIVRGFLDIIKPRGRKRL
jgi:hypothetical protein